MSMNTDVCFIGGGIACLYAAYKTLQANPKSRIAILEKNRRFGGRAHNAQFHGVEIPKGAGIGRFHKDRLLRNLMIELEIPINTYFGSNQAIGFERVDVMAIVEQLKKRAGEYDRSVFTFAKFARVELGASLYRRFVASVGYTDFENADIFDTLYHYGFEDTQGIKCFVVPWNLLVDRLIEKITEMGGNRVKMLTHVNVMSIQKTESGGEYIVSGSGPLQVACKRVMVGTSISTLRKLFKDVVVYRYINSQPFLRVYGLIDGNARFKEKINQTTLVKNDLQKIIPMRGDVFMIAYADNKKALRLVNHAHDLAYMSKMLESVSGLNGVVVQDVHVKYWEEGTHYYLPLPEEFKSRKEFVRQCQNPKNGVKVIGEAVAMRYQGWTEGALESVHEVL